MWRGLLVGETETADVMLGFDSFLCVEFGQLDGDLVW